jgi:hypothetical protein
MEIKNSLLGAKGEFASDLLKTHCQSLLNFFETNYGRLIFSATFSGRHAPTSIRFLPYLSFEHLGFRPEAFATEMSKLSARQTHPQGQRCNALRGGGKDNETKPVRRQTKSTASHTSHN